MLKYALMVVGAAVLVALVFVLLPIHSGPRQEPRLLSGGDAPAATNFTIHDAGPPAPVVSPGVAAPATAPAAAAAAPAAQADLDAVIQRLRNGKPDPAVAPPPPAATPDPAATAALVPPATDPAPARSGSVTSQGTRWRLARSGGGYTVSIDLGGGQIADVHVQAAFANLDPSAVNTRVDFLRDTILENFSRQSGSYTFSRDGSVSVDR